MEVFKEISAGSFTYFIGNKGTVRNMKKELSQKTKSNGYKEVCLYIDKKPKMKYVHRLVAENFINTIPAGHVVNHKDGNKANNDVVNLEIVTYSENSMHSTNVLGNKAPVFKGSSHGMAKLNENIVLDIRYFYEMGHSLDTLAGMFNTPKSTICKVVYRQTWKHIEIKFKI